MTRSAAMAQAHASIDDMKRASFIGQLLDKASAQTKASDTKRGRDLTGFGINSRGSHDETIAAIRAKLAFNLRLERNRPGAGLMQIHLMWLLAQLVAEGRLKNATRKVAGNNSELFFSAPRRSQLQPAE